jgi:hypothetical protein
VTRSALHCAPGMYTRLRRSASIARAPMLAEECVKRFCRPATVA